MARAGVAVTVKVLRGRLVAVRVDEVPQQGCTPAEDGCWPPPAAAETYVAGTRPDLPLRSLTWLEIRGLPVALRLRVIGDELEVVADGRYARGPCVWED